MNRRHFVSSLAGAGLFQDLSRAQAPRRPEGPRRYDLLIKNGELRDPSQSIKRKADIGIADGKIAAIEDSIGNERGYEVIDAKGLLVTPGLVDLHTHCYHSATEYGIDPDPVAARSGVTTWVDAGSFDYYQAPGFRKFVVQPAKVRVYGFIYLYANSRNPDIDVISYVRKGLDRTGQMATDNADIILGVKFQVGSNMNGRYSLDMLKAARELCDKYKLPLMAHISFNPPETHEVMELMRPGDIITHVYNAHGIGIFEKDGKLKPSVKEARARGVLFDVGHGAGSFNFDIARRGLEAGFVADTVSTDVYKASVNGPVFDMPTTMTKMMYVGMSFDDVLLRTTIAPARIINRLPGMGQLKVGGPADLALLALEEGEFRLVDSQRNVVTAKQRVASRLTIAKGRKVLAV